MNAFDSDGWLDLAAAKARGAIAVGLYLGNNLTIPITETAAALNMGLWSFGERQSYDPDFGAPKGTEDAIYWCRLAHEVRQPPGAAIYMANDQEVTNFPATMAYFQAAAHVVLSEGYAPGMYCQTSIWDDVKGFGYKYFCHASDGTPPPYPEAHIVQGGVPEQEINGVSVDVDQIQTPHDFGGWNSKGLWPQAPPPPIEDNMTLHDIDVTFNANNVGTATLGNVLFAKAASATLLSGAGGTITGLFLTPTATNGTLVTVKGGPKGTTVSVRVAALSA